MPPKSTAVPVPVPIPQMHRYDDRLASFSTTSNTFKAKGRARRQHWPLTSKTHPLLSPENMAHAGFFYAPTGSDAGLDTCQCFLCGVKLGGWDREDDPWKEHAARGNCAWAETVCQVEIEKRAEIITSSQVRENTFYSKDRETCWWPHPADDFIPNPSTLAEAGFIFCPTVNEIDLVRCPLCEYEVEGWESIDVPMVIHRRRRPDCAFFVAEVQSKGKRAKQKKAIVENDIESIPTVPMTTQKTHTRTNSRSQPILISASAPAPRTRQQTSEAPSEAPKPTRNTRARPKRNQKEDEVDIEVIDLVQEEDDEDVVRSAREEPQSEMDEVVEVQEVKSKGKKGKSDNSKSTSSSTRNRKTVVENDQPAESEEMEMIDTQPLDVDTAMDVAGTVDEESVSVPVVTKKSRSKSSRKTIKASVPEPESQTMTVDLNEATTNNESQSQSQPDLKKSTSAKSKSKSTKSKSKSKSKAVTEVMDDEIPETQDDGVESSIPEREPEVASQPTSKPSRKPRTTIKPKKTDITPPTIDEFQSKSSTTSVNGKPLPALPALPTLPTSPPAPLTSSRPLSVQNNQGQIQERPLSQLNRFANMPPSSPISAPIPTQNQVRVTKAIPKKGHSQPARSRPEVNQVGQAIPVENGAKAARAVVDSSLSQFISQSPRPTQSSQTSIPSQRLPLDQSQQTSQTQNHTPNQNSTMSENQMDMEKASRSNPLPLPPQKSLSESLEMTLEDWIRSEMVYKKLEIEQEGKERIKAFEKRTIEARRRIEGLPTR